METFKFVQLGQQDIQRIARLSLYLNPGSHLAQQEQYLAEMFQYSHYCCFGLYDKEQLIAVSGGWITIRLYSGKQLEIDHVIVDPEKQSKGIGALFLQHIENWAKAADCRSIELNTYVENSASHKFYFNQGYKILGYHFQKKIDPTTSSHH